MHTQWIDRWREGRTGWHEADGNAALKKHWTARNRRVLVPLCGASPDLLWLAERDNDVVGVELSALAAESFFADHQIEFTREDGDQPVFAADDLPLRIVVGDYLAFGETGFDALYDRASLVALPADVRPRYARHTKHLVTPDAYHLLVTLEYDQSLADGPPFSLPSQEVLSYWPDLTRIEVCSDRQDGPPKFDGLPRLDEIIWLRD